MARRAALLAELGARVESQHGVKVHCLPGDLASADFVQELGYFCSGLDLGTLVYNAAFAPVGDLASAAAEELAEVVQVNVSAPLLLTRALLPHLLERGRGAVILMTSLAGNQGSSYIAAYAASKAFNRVLAESLWQECRSRRVDVLACCAGAVRTPGYAVTAAKRAPGTLDPDEVVEAALSALGRRPVVIPGAVNKIAAFVMRRVLPLRSSITLMARSTRELGSVPAGSAPGQGGRTPPVSEASSNQRKEGS